MKYFILLILLTGCEVKAQSKLEQLGHDSYCKAIENQYMKDAEAFHALKKAYEELKAKCEGDTTVHKVGRIDSPHSGYLNGLSSFQKKDESSFYYHLKENPKKLFDSTKYPEAQTLATHVSSLINLPSELVSSGVLSSRYSTDGFTVISGDYSTLWDNKQNKRQRDMLDDESMICLTWEQYNSLTRELSSSASSRRWSSTSTSTSVKKSSTTNFSFWSKKNYAKTYIEKGSVKTNPYMFEFQWYATK